MKLPLNCDVEYVGDFLSQEDADVLFDELDDILQSINFQPHVEDEKTYQVNFGKVMFLDQNLLDENIFAEQQWGPTRCWTHKLRVLKEKIEEFAGHEFPVCVLIHYPDGNSGVDYHSDYTAFGDTSLIPSISLGEERAFNFRAKANGLEFSLILENGSLVVMGKHCQDRYEHSLPINPKYKNPRINLTFRNYGFGE